MILVKNNSFHYEVGSRKTPYLNSLVFLFIVSFISGCSTYIASKQDDLLTQIDVWSVENEYGKAFETLNYIKPSHPQYQELQVRKKSLNKEAQHFELETHNKILALISEKNWAMALDLMDQAKAKYPQSKNILKTEQHVLQEQKKQLSSVDRKIMLERARWMIKARPVYLTKLTIDPRNDVLKAHVDNLNKESKELAQKLTLLSRQAIKNRRYKTARIFIVQAIELKPDQERNKILSELKIKEKKIVRSLKQAKKRTHKNQQNTLLLDIEKNFKNGNLLRTRQLIAQLDERERQHPELIQLEQELDRSINYTIQRLLADANRAYTEGQFEKAIALWEEVLSYDPENKLATDNIHRAEKVIEKLKKLRKKQQS